jgi:C4-dicarboxylate-specific signal transduction histidine kinase
MLENLMELVRHRKIQKDAVDVNAVLSKSMNLLGDELRIRRIGWDLHLDKDLPEVFADALHLQQVFMNLTVNAMEALSDRPSGLTRTLEITTPFFLRTMVLALNRKTKHAFLIRFFLPKKRVLAWV